MNTKLYSLIALIFLFGCNKSENEEAKPEPQRIIETVEIAAPSMQDAYIDVPTTQNAKVLLPPYYESETDKNYPVVYFIHGYGGSYKDSYGIFGAAYDEMVAGNIDPFFIVTVNSTCKIGGTFCANSPVTGNWEQHITEEVIAYIDANFRTIATKEARAIAGFSMGGFGCLYLGLRHADTYNLVYAIAPGVLIDGDLESANEIWVNDGGSFRNAYGATFSPNTELSYPHGEKPAFDGSDDDNRIIDNWYSGFGNFRLKVDEYLAGTAQLKKIGLEYGTADYYPWIPRGTQKLADVFTEKNINHVVTKIPVGFHEVSEDYVISTMLPFFDEGFEHE